MSAVLDPRPPLDPDPESIERLRATLEDVAYDTAQQALRPDYFTSPFPHFEELEGALAGLTEGLATALRLLSLAQPVPLGQVERALGRAFAEAGLATGLLVYDPDAGALRTDGYSVVSRLGRHYVVSTNPYYPTFNPATADVYLGPDSFSLATHLDRLAASLPRDGSALDLCAGSGIAGQTLAARHREQQWLAVDLVPTAVEAAAFNAALNGVADRYRTAAGDLYAPAGADRFDLIVCNPPFIPVPRGRSFPRYGAGGEDGLALVRPIVEGLNAHLTERGRAVLYAEGIGDKAGPFVTTDLLRVAHHDRLGFDLTLIARATIAQALYTLGLVLSRQRPSRLEEIVHWKTSFERQRATHYFKYVLVARRDRPGVAVRSVARST